MDRTEENVAQTAERLVLTRGVIHTNKAGDEFVIDSDGHPHYVFENKEVKRIFDDAESLSEYVNRFKDSRAVLIADQDRAKVGVILDYRSDLADNLSAKRFAALQLRYSEEFEVWNQWQGTLHEQEDFMVFLEENGQDITRPDSADLLDVVRDFHAVKTIVFKSSKRLDNGDRSFTYQDETDQKGEMTLPSELILNMPIYEGEPATELIAKFRYRMDGGRLRLGYDWHRIEPTKKAAFGVAANRVAEATGLTALYGRYGA